MMRVEVAIREIYEQLPSDDPEKAKVWLVLQGVEYDNRQLAFPPPTPEQLANLESLTNHELHEAYMGESDLVKQLSFRYEVSSEEERRAAHKEMMDALKVVKAISQELSKRRQ